MKKHTTCPFLLFGLLFVLAGPPASAQGKQMTANIPFEFGVRAYGALPAGTYTVTDLGETILLKNNSGKSAIGLIVQRVYGTNGPGKTMLVFRRYGTQYFLARVLDADGMTNDVAMTTAEKRMIEERRRRLAQNEIEPEIVTVASRR